MHLVNNIYNGHIPNSTNSFTFNYHSKNNCNSQYGLTRGFLFSICDLRELCSLIGIWGIFTSIWLLIKIEKPDLLMLTQKADLIR